MIKQYSKIKLRWYCLAFISWLMTSMSMVHANSSPVIAAAANIQFALDIIANNFEQQTGQKVRISYGSSGNFATQIQHGAPFEILLSADEFYIEQLFKAGSVKNNGHIYAIGSLAIAAPLTSPLKLDAELRGLAQLMSEGKLTRFAIANPAHAPYGERAKEVLQAKGMWQTIEPKLVLGESASQAAQFVVSGSTEGGIVPLSLVLTPQFKKMGHYIALPTSLHQPLNQRMVLMPNASATSKAFYRYMQSDAAKSVLTQHGYRVPSADGQQ